MKVNSLERMNQSLWIWDVWPWVIQESGISQVIGGPAWSRSVYRSRGHAVVQPATPRAFPLGPWTIWPKWHRLSGRKRELRLEAVYGRGFAGTCLRAMELITIANRCYRFRGFVYQHADFSADKKSIEVAVRSREGSAAVCSRCHFPAPGENAWIPIGEEAAEDWANWSPDGKMLYFTSAREMGTSTCGRACRPPHRTDLWEKPSQSSIGTDASLISKAAGRPREGELRQCYPKVQAIFG